MVLDWLKTLAGQRPLNQADVYGEHRRAQLSWLRDADPSIPEVEAAVIGLTTDPDGYVREAAVQRLRPIRSSAAFRACVNRMNDWVPQVRSAATMACETVLDQEALEVLLANLDVLLDLKRWTRVGHGDFLARLQALIDDPRSRPEVMRRFPASQGRVARFLLETMMAWPDADRVQLAVLAAGHGDVSVRSGMLRNRGFWAFEGRRNLLLRLTGDRHPKICRGALGLLWELERNAPETAAAIELALLSPSQSVRDFALWCARDMVFDLDAYLTQRAVEFPGAARHDLGFIGLVSSLKAKSWLPLIREACNDPRPGIRRAALAAWARIDGRGAELAVGNALNEASGKVRKLAFKLVQKGSVALSLEQIQSAADTALCMGAFERFVLLTQHMPYWDRLAALFAALPRAHASPDRQVLLMAFVHWERQRKYGFASLSPEQQARLRTGYEISGLKGVWAERFQGVFPLVAEGLAEPPEAKE
ncbi:MAG: hypothetical protein AB1899_13260 [Pseudomonadota bacterium]